MLLTCFKKSLKQNQFYYSFKNLPTLCCFPLRIPSSPHVVWSNKEKLYICVLKKLLHLYTLGKLSHIAVDMKDRRPEHAGAGVVVKVEVFSTLQLTELKPNVAKKTEWVIYK